MSSATSLPQAAAPTAAPGASQIPALVLAGWLVPGLGHFFAGMRRRAVVFLILIGGAFVAGVLVSNYEAVSRDLHPYALWAQLGVGGATLPLLYWDPAAKYVLPANRTTDRFEVVPRGTDSGLLLCSIAGILNVLLLFDLIERLLGTPSRRKQAP